MLSNRICGPQPRGFAALALLTLAAHARAQTPSYSVLQTGPLPGNNGSFAEGIDNAGRVIGWSDTVAGFHWEAGSLVALPPLPGGTQTRAEGIDDNGVVLGYSQSSGIITQAVAWFPSVAGFDSVGLGIAPGDLFSSALARGGSVIAGYSDNAIHPRPVAWLPPAQPPGSYTLEVLPFLPGDFAGIATGVDATGRAYGFSANLGMARPTRWTRSGGAWTVTDLGALAPNFGAEVMAVAPSGLAVGYSVSPATFLEHAVLWGSSGIVDLGALNTGWRAHALGVNAHGDVVGTSGSFAFDTGWVRLNSTGTMIDINAHLPPGTPWTVHSAVDIADDGRIAATAARNGFYQTVLLTPVSTFLTDISPGAAGQLNTLTVADATPGGTVRFVWARGGGQTAIASCPSIAFDLQMARTIGTSVADTDGNATITWMIPGSLSGNTVVFQALDTASCRVTNVKQVSL